MKLLSSLSRPALNRCIVIVAIFFSRSCLKTIKLRCVSSSSTTRPQQGQLQASRQWRRTKKTANFAQHQCRSRPCSCVALAYRLLWSRLSLCLWTSTSQSEDGLKFPCDILSKWLRRSSPLPFSLKITFKWDEAPLHCTCHMDRDTTLDDILIEHCLRWEGLDIGLTSSLY